MERWQIFDGGARRAPRFTFELPLQFRPGGQGAWRAGRGTNISRSGVLFQADRPPLDLQTVTEVSFLVPAQIRNGPPATVICQGRVARQVVSDDPNAEVAVAVTIEAYRFERDRTET